MARKRKRELDAEAVRDYFERRLSEVRWQGAQGIARCPFHDDQHPSLSINAELGVFFCHSCGAKGELLTFESLISRCDRGTARQNLSGLLIYR